MAASARATRPRRAREARIAFGHVQVPDRFKTAAVAIEQSFKPGTSITRYNRTWYLGQVRIGEAKEVDGLVVTGRIGFDRLVGTSPLWDEGSQDFALSAVREGSTSPFALHVSTRRVAFQLRSSTIKRHSFCGALQALLNEASPYDGWEIQPEAVATSFEDWRTNIAARVVKVSAVVKVPNPHYEDDDVEQLLDQADADVARLELTGHDLKLSDSQILAQFFHHADRKPEYGHYRAQGMTTAGRRTEFDSRADESPLDAMARVDPVTKEVSTSALSGLVAPPDKQALGAPPDQQALKKASPPSQAPRVKKAGNRSQLPGSGPQAPGLSQGGQGAGPEGRGPKKG